MCMSISSFARYSKATSPFHNSPKAPKTSNMYKFLFVFAMVLAVALAGPVLLLQANTGRVAYEHGWTDGPNNGVGPLLISPYAYTGLTHVVG
ncbi:unnamed protein product [Allacma fusca]|uniref:Uncharacterized protein n=1 Tax=Allacma fusca TaxID=39272 RepID=A0A8J2L382_9HEXA|nr:unnamed protein product [Allacma fusca]